MKALTYHGSKDVRVDTVPDPTLVDADDIILRVTATAICGSDLHIYRGKILMMESGDILGHEFMGVVEEVGAAVTRVRKGDRVVIPFTISCGKCFYCNRKLFAACETTNTGRGAIFNKKDTRAGAALFGYSHLYGGIPGGQAEFVRVPKANVGPLVIQDATVHRTSSAPRKSCTMGPPSKSASSGFIACIVSEDIWALSASSSVQHSYVMKRPGRFLSSSSV